MANRPRTERVVVLATWRFDGWELPAFEPDTERSWIAGGERTLLELAAAAASVGYTVELRGRFPEAEVAEIECAAGVALERPQTARAADRVDTLIVPEGLADPAMFARATLSPARAVLAVLAAPGLFGWAFDRDGPPPDLMTVDPRSVGRPEQLEAARYHGLEVWTNLRAVADQAQANEIPHSYVGVGRPRPYPEPPAKRVDVAILADNKWTPLAREAIAGLRPDVLTAELRAMPHQQLLRELGAARVLVHPVRIEGRSRLCEEARAMRTVPVMLASNHIGEGMTARSGGVAVDSIEAIPAAVHALLDDPARLAELARAGYSEARRVGEWSTFVERVSEALARPDADVARFAAGRAALGARLAERERELAADFAAREQQLRSTAADREAALHDDLTGAQRHAQELSAALIAAQARFEALRGRKIVRAGLAAARAIDRLPIRRGRS